MLIEAEWRLCLKDRDRGVLKTVRELIERGEEVPKGDWGLLSRLLGIKVIRDYCLCPSLSVLSVYFPGAKRFTGRTESFIFLSLIS